MSTKLYYEAVRGSRDSLDTLTRRKFISPELLMKDGDGLLQYHAETNGVLINVCNDRELVRCERHAGGTLVITETRLVHRSSSGHIVQVNLSDVLKMQFDRRPCRSLMRRLRYVFTRDGKRAGHVFLVSRSEQKDAKGKHLTQVLRMSFNNVVFEYSRVRKAWNWRDSFDSISEE